MKIIAYSPHPMINLRDAAGSTIRTRAMIEAFAQLGHQVRPVIMGDVTTGNQGSVVGAETAQKARLAKRFMPAYVWESVKDFMLNRYDQQAHATLEQAIREEQPDLIYETAHYLQLSGIRLAQQYGIPHIYEMNGSFPDERILLSGRSVYVSRLWPQAYRAERYQLQHTDRVVVVSSRIREVFQTRHQVPAHKFTLSPNGVFPERLQADPERQAQLSAQMDLGGATVIGFVGSIFPYHGVDILLDGFAQALQQAPELKLRLLIVGGGGILPELQQKAKAMGMGEQVIFTGSVDHGQVFTYLDLMDITVLARTEPYMSPIKLFEYGAMGKAVIAPDQPGVRDVMTHEKDGLLIAPQAEAVAAAILRYLKAPDFRHQMATHFQERVMAHYTWKKTAATILEDWQHSVAPDMASSSVR